MRDNRCAAGKLITNYVVLKRMLYSVPSSIKVEIKHHLNHIKQILCNKSKEHTLFRATSARECVFEYIANNLQDVNYDRCFSLLDLASKFLNL